jgi:hypothetical protein
VVGGRWSADSFGFRRFGFRIFNLVKVKPAAALEPIPQSLMDPKMFDRVGNPCQQVMFLAPFTNFRLKPKTKMWAAK